MNEILHDYLINHSNYKEELNSDIAEVINSIIEEEECRLNNLFNNLYFSLADYINPPEFYSRYSIYKRIKYFIEEIEDIIKDNKFIKNRLDYSLYDYMKDHYNSNIKIDIRDLINNNYSAIYEIINHYADETMKVR